MKATVTYKTGTSIMTKTMDDVVKIEKTHNRYGDKLVEETRVYTSDYHWATWLSDGIINIFIEA